MRHVRIDELVAIVCVLEDSGHAVAHPGTDSLQLGGIAVLRVNSHAVLSLTFDHFTVHDHTCLDLLVHFDVEKVKVTEDNLAFTTVAAMDQHERAETGGCVVHTLLRWDSRALKFGPGYSIAVKAPDIVEARHHVQVGHISATTTK